MTRLQQALATCLTVVTVVQLSGSTFSCSPPCLNGGVCVSDNTCVCTAEFEGPICITPRTPPVPSKPNCHK